MSKPLALLIRMLAVIFNAKSISGLGWTDICSFTGLTSSCYIWNANTAPFNDISAVLNSPVCSNGCILNLNPFSGSCTNFSACAVLAAGLSAATPAFTLDTTLTIAIDGVTLQSMSESTSVQISGTFTAIMVTGQNVNLVGLDFVAPVEPGDVPLSDLASVIWTGGGNVQISRLASASSYTAVLFVGISQFLNLTLDNVLRTPLLSTAVYTALPVAVVILQAANISLFCGPNMAVNSVFFHGNTFFQGPSMTSACTQNLNLTNFSQTVPAFPACSKPTTIQLDKNCPNPAIFATLVMVLSLSAAALIIPLVFMFIERLQRKMHSNSVQTTKMVASS